MMSNALVKKAHSESTFDIVKETDDVLILVFVNSSNSAEDIDLGKHFSVIARVGINIINNITQP